MPLIRAIARLILLLLTVLLVPVTLLLALLFGLAGPRSRHAFVMVATPIVCGIYLACFGVRLSVQGHRRDDVAVFVGNHISYVDIFVAGRAVAGIFVSRHDVRRWPVIGWLARIGGTVFIDRSSIRSAIESSRGIVERATSGARVVLFPEGGILPGPGVKSFKPFLIASIAAAGLPVQPFAIVYTGIHGKEAKGAAAEVVRWDDQPLPRHAWHLLRLRRIDATVFFMEPVVPPTEPDSREARRFAEELRRRVDEVVRSQTEVPHVAPSDFSRPTA